MATTQTTDVPSDAAKLTPSWLEANVFEIIVKETVPDYKQIKSLNARPALSAGENYATVILGVDLDVELNDGNTKTIPYILKLAHQLPITQLLLKTHNIFAVEQGIFLEVVPEFEQMFRDIGEEVKFGAKCYKLPIPSETHYVLLEDLRPRGFKNANRLEGLDMDHTKAVLQKLAKWHAASATRIETKGKYVDLYSSGFFTEPQKPMMDQMCQAMGKVLVQCAHSYQGHEDYIDLLERLQPRLTDDLYNLAKVDPNEFNVLNHGDLWCNNIMFQYDAFGKIKETYFVDYQLTRYGSVASDLLYFLISSTKFELKLKQFEYFIKFYHDNLLANLTLLKYPKKPPTLKEIHIALYKYGLIGYITATGVMGAVLLDPTEKATTDNFMPSEENSAGDDLKMLMYSNPRYRKHIEAVLPWLLNRGALEI